MHGGVQAKVLALSLGVEHSEVFTCEKCVVCVAVTIDVDTTVAELVDLRWNGCAVERTQEAVRTGRTGRIFTGDYRAVLIEAVSGVLARHIGIGHRKQCTPSSICVVCDQAIGLRLPLLCDIAVRAVDRTGERPARLQIPRSPCAQIDGAAYAIVEHAGGWILHHIRTLEQLRGYG